MTTAEYWAKRAEMRMDQGMAAADKVAAELLKSYQDMQKQVDYEVKRIFERYGDEYRLSYADAVKDIANSQYKEWRMTLAEYVERINATGDDELLRELNTLSARSRATRWQQVEMAIKVNASELAAKQEQLVEKLLGDQYQRTYYGQVFDIHKGLGFGKALEMLNGQQVAETLAYPWSGANFSERIWGAKERLTNTLRQTLTEGLIQGQDTRQMAQRIQAAMGSSFKQAETLIRTETAHIVERGTMDGYGAEDVDKYEILATLDKRTSKICQHQDSKVYAVKDAKVGVNMPPFHVRCRTTTVAVIDEDDVADGLRAAKDGNGGYQLMPANMTYDQWYDRHVTQATEAEFNALVQGVTAADGLKITKVSSHAIDQAIARRVSAGAAKQALTESLEIGKIRVDEKGRSSKRYVGEQATVAVNPDTGVVASLNPTHSKTVKKLKAKKGE